MNRLAKLYVVFFLLTSDVVVGWMPHRRRRTTATTSVTTSSRGQPVPSTHAVWQGQILTSTSSSTPTTQLLANDVRGGGGGEKTSTSTSQRRGIDWGAVFKYGIGMGVQVGLIYGLFAGVDRLLAKLSWKVPFYVNVVFFYLFNTQTGKFNPLSQQSDTKERSDNFQKPAWTPPGWVFSVMWPLFVFGIRAVTAAMMVDASNGVYATGTLMTLFVHLSFGNLWNIMYV